MSEHHVHHVDGMSLPLGSITALAQRGCDTSQGCFGEHPHTPSPSGSVWKGGVKNGKIPGISENCSLFGHCCFTR